MLIHSTANKNKTVKSSNSRCIATGRKQNALRIILSSLTQGSRAGTKKKNKTMPSSCDVSRTQVKKTRGNNVKKSEPGSITRVDLYHGTPLKASAENIIRYGWKTTAKCGATFGHGVYLSDDINLAKGYAGGLGHILKVRLEIPTKMILRYDKDKLSPLISEWLKRKGESDAVITPVLISAYALQNGYKIIIHDKEWVLVTPNSAGAEYWRKPVKGRWYRAVALLDATGNFIKAI